MDPLVDPPLRIQLPPAPAKRIDKTKRLQQHHHRRRSLSDTADSSGDSTCRSLAAGIVKVYSLLLSFHFSHFLSCSYTELFTRQVPKISLPLNGGSFGCPASPPPHLKASPPLSGVISPPLQQLTAATSTTSAAAAAAAAFLFSNSFAPPTHPPSLHFPALSASSPRSSSEGSISSNLSTGSPNHPSKPRTGDSVCCLYVECAKPFLQSTKISVISS